MKKIITVILSVLLLTATLTMFASCGSNSPEDAVKAYAKMLEKPSKSNIEALAPDCFWEEMESEYEVTPEALANLIGGSGGRKIDYTVTATEELDLDEWKDAHASLPGIDSEQVTAVYSCELDTDESRVFFDTFTVIEVDGNYYAAEVLQLFAMSASSL